MKASKSLAFPAMAALIAAIVLCFSIFPLEVAATTGDSSGDASQDSGAGVVSSPSSDSSQDSSAGVISSPSTDSAQDSFGPSPGGGGGGGGGGGSGETGGTGRRSNSSSGSQATYFGTGIAPGFDQDLTATSCPLISSYMKRGRINDPVEVAKLQAFFKNSQELDVDVNGTFDQKTEDAVSAFQSAYVETVLRPWGATLPSGEVYITTRKKVNELACGQPFTLTAGETTVIQAFVDRKRGLAEENAPGQVPAVSVEGRSTAVEIPDVMSSTSSTTVQSQISAGAGDDILVVGTDTANAAAASSPSVLRRFWNFVVGIFK